MGFVCQGGMNSKEKVTLQVTGTNRLNNPNAVSVHRCDASEGLQIKMGSSSDDPINCLSYKSLIFILFLSVSLMNIRLHTTRHLSTQRYRKK